MYGLQNGEGHLKSDLILPLTCSKKKEGDDLVTTFLSYPPESRVHAAVIEYENVSQKTIYHGTDAHSVHPVRINNTVFAGGAGVDTFNV